MAILDVVEEFLSIISRFVGGKQAVDYCEISAALAASNQQLEQNPNAKPNILVCNDSTFISVYDLKGTYQILGLEAFSDICNDIRSSASGYFGEGHQISIVFEDDPERGPEILKKAAEPKIKTAKRIGLDSTDMIVDTIKKNSSFVSDQRAYIILYTSPSAIDKDQIKLDIKEINSKRKALGIPSTLYGQTPAIALESIKIAHDTFCQAIENTLTNAGEAGEGILIKKISAHSIIRDLKGMVQRKSTNRNWKPVLFGDKFIPCGKDTQEQQDSSNLTAPQIPYQIFSHDIEHVKSKGRNTEIIYVDGTYHGNMSMCQFPREVQVFEALQKSIDKKIPWRVRFDITPNGLSSKKINNMISSFTAMTENNKAIRNSFNYMRDIVNDGSDIDSGIAISFSTWADDVNTLQRRMSHIEKSIQGWGGCNVANVHGDPFAIWTATMPAMTRNNPSITAVSPFHDCLQMLPLRQPASIWKTGQVLFRTLAGKPYPVELCSPEQDLWLEAITSPPGSGKSVLLNTLNNAQIHSPGATKLPLVTWIDKGRSAQGLASFLKDSLPKERIHEVTELTLQNSIDFGVNQFDLPLGCRIPTNHDKSYLRSFLTTLCYDPSRSSAPDSVSDVMGDLIDIAYSEKHRRSPNLYEKGIESSVDSALEELGAFEENDEEWWSNTPWYEVMDYLFKHGKVFAATLAQRQAVPTLPDCSAALNNSSIVQLYGEAKTSTGEPLLKYINRKLSSAVNKYPCFAGKTVFDLSSESRVVIIEMGQVLEKKTPEGRINNTIFYMFARNLGAKNYFLTKDSLLPVVPDLYRDYHIDRLQNISEEMKSLCWDEFHNTGGLDVIVDMVITDAREGRKSGVRISIVTQYLNDIPSTLLEAASSIYVLRGKGKGNSSILKDTIGITADAQEMLDRECNGPSSKGSNMLAIFRTKKGMLTQVLNNTLGPIELWAYNTNLWDMALRAQLYEAIGARNARKVLATAFPSGTAAHRINSLKNKMNDDVENTNSVYKILVEELIKENLDLINDGDIHE